MSRTPRPVLQLDEHDCGPACLRYVTHVFGGDMPQAQIRDLCQVGGRGISLLQMKRAAPRLGLGVRFFEASRLDPALDQQTPWIAQFRSREEGLAHFVVVDAVGSRTVTVMDPSAGRVRLTHDDFTDQWTGIMAGFTDEGIAPAKPDDTRWIWRYVWQGRRRTFLLISLLAAVVVSLLGIGSAYVTKAIIDAATAAPFTGMFWWSLMGFLAFSLAQYLVRAGAAYLSQFLAALLVGEGTDAMTARFSRLRWAYVSILRRGDIVNRLKDPAEVEEFLIIQCGQLAATVLTFVLGFGWVVVLYPAMVPAVLVAVVLSVANFWFFRDRLLSLSYRLKSCEVSIDNLLVDYANCHETLTSVDGGEVILRRFRQRVRELQRLRVRRTRLLVVMGLLAALCPLLVMGWAVLLLWASGTNDVSRLADLVFQLTATGFIFGAIASALGLLTGVDAMRVSFDRLRDVHTSAPEDPGPTPEALEEPVRRFELRDFRFRAGLREVTLSWSLELTGRPQPCVVAVTGANGRGKSSLLRALAGVTESRHAGVLINGRPAPGLAALRSWSSYLPQDDQLFSGSVGDNILLGHPDGEVADLERVLTAVDVLPGVPATEVAQLRVLNGGDNFSGGEARRIAIARALCQPGPILLLDEPFSSIDQESTTRLTELIRSSARDLVLVVTHDPQTLAPDEVLDLGALLVERTGPDDTSPTHSP